MIEFRITTVFLSVLIPEVCSQNYLKILMDTDITGKSGETCVQSGVYKCTLHPSNEVPIAKGSLFPKCKIKEDHLAQWIFVRKPGTTSSSHADKFFVH